MDKDLDVLFARLENKKRLMIREPSQKLISLLKKEGKIEDILEENDESLNSSLEKIAKIPKVETTSDSDIGKSNIVLLSAVGKYQPLSGVGKVYKKLKHLYATDVVFLYPKKKN